MTYTKNPKNITLFLCDNCNYKTSNKKDYNKHLITRKHIKNSNDLHKIPEKSQDHIYSCSCGKNYIYRQSLWSHKKTCMNDSNTKENDKIYEENDKIYEENDKSNEENDKSNEEIKELKNMFVKMIEINKDLQNQLIELSKEKTIINNNTNCNNSFNLHIFLNEKCKDAPNLIDFINSIHLKLTDFENFGTFGYADNISRILLREIKDVDIYKRPIHCSDLKREVIHVKDENAWKKDEDKMHMKKAIKEIAYKNFKTIIPEWIKENPESKDITSKKHDQYIKMMSNSMGEVTEEGDEKNYNKIIRTVAKEILVEK